MWGLLWRWCCKIEIPNKLFRRQFLNNLFKNLLKMHRHKPEYCNSDRFKDMLNSFRYQLQLRGKPSYKNITLTSQFSIHFLVLTIVTVLVMVLILSLMSLIHIFPYFFIPRTFFHREHKMKCFEFIIKKKCAQIFEFSNFYRSKNYKYDSDWKIHLRWLPSMKASWPPGGRL